MFISGVPYHSLCLACPSPFKLSCILPQAFNFLNTTAVNVLRTLAVPQALGVKISALDFLLDDTALQRDQPSQSRLSITQTCNSSDQQPCKPCEDEGLLTLIFTDRPDGFKLQVSNSCSQLQVCYLLLRTSSCASARGLAEILCWLSFNTTFNAFLFEACCMAIHQSCC